MKYFSSIIFAALVIMSCGQNTSNSADVKGTTAKTSGGFDYTVYSNKGSVKVDTNTFIIASYRMMADDSIIENSANFPEEPIINIPPNFDEIPVKHPILEVAKGLAKGDSFVIYMPSDSLPQAKFRAPNAKMFSYHVSLKDVMNQEEFNGFQEKKKQERDALIEESKKRIPVVEKELITLLDQFKNGKLQVETTATGLKKHTIQAGSGENFKKGDKASVQYYGALESDGKMFDNSFSRGQPFQFVIGQGSVIKGWDEGLPMMKHGEKALFIIPAALAYGANSPSPAIPANSDLVFYIEAE